MQSDAELEQSFAKEQLGVSSTESKLLGLKWKKNSDQLAVTFPAKEPEVVTKRSVLSHLASVFDPLGLAAPIVISGKFIYRSVCDSQLPRDKELPEPLLKYWHVWNYQSRLKSPGVWQRIKRRCSESDLHALGDTSGKGTAAAVYAVVRQARGVTQGLVTAKARLAKKELTMPKLELVAGLMAAKLLHNVKRVLKRFPVEECYGWLYSTVALYWINGSGNYKQFDRNRVKQIKEKSYIKWKKIQLTLEAEVAVVIVSPRNGSPVQRGCPSPGTGHLTLSHRQARSLTLK